MFPVLLTKAELTDRFSHPPPPPEKPRSPASMERRSAATANRRSAAAATRAAAPLNPEAMTLDEIKATGMDRDGYLDYLFKGLPDKERQAGITASEDSLYEAAMGMENPLVALGSDPMRTFFGPFAFGSSGSDSRTIGTYRPGSDMAYVGLPRRTQPDGSSKIEGMKKAKDTYKHESIHRALKILSDKYPELDKYRGGFRNYLSGFGSGLEERIISQALGHAPSSDAAKVPHAKEFQELMETLDKLARKELMPQSPASMESRSEAERAETVRGFGLEGLLWDTLTQSKTDNDPAYQTAYENAMSRFPRLKGIEMNLIQRPRVDDEPKIEFYPANEGRNPLPGTPTLELRGTSLQGGQLEDAIAGDLLHYLGSAEPVNDPEYRNLKMSFMDGWSNSERQFALEKFKTHQGKHPEDRRSFDQWFDTVWTDMWIGGLLFPGLTDEFTNAAPRVLSKSQMKNIQDMRSLLQRSSTQPHPRPKAKTDNDSALPPTETVHRNGDDRFVNIGREKAHATGGEVFVHPEVLEANPAIWSAIQETMTDMGADPSQAIVGSPYGNYGLDGDQEFWLHKKTWRAAKKAFSNPWVRAIATIGTALIPGVGPWLAPVVAGGTTAIGGGSVNESLFAAGGAAIGGAYGATTNAAGTATVTISEQLAAGATANGFGSALYQAGGDILASLGAVGAAIGGANLGTLSGLIAGAGAGQSIGAAIDGPPELPQGQQVGLNGDPLSFDLAETPSLPGDPVGLGEGPVDSVLPGISQGQQVGLIEEAPEPFRSFGSEVGNGVSYIRNTRDRNTGLQVFNTVSGPDNTYSRLQRRGFGGGVGFV